MTDTKTRMTVAAAQLFQRHGYHAVGFRRIVEESGAPRGSIYHHFPGGKEQLAVEAVALSGAAMLRTIEQVTAEAADVAGMLEGLAEVLAGWLETSAFEAGCPVALMHHRPMPQGRTDVLIEVYDWLEDRIAECEAAGIPRSAIIVDPGLGFAKEAAHSYEVLAGLSAFEELRNTIKAETGKEMEMDDMVYGFVKIV